MAVIGVGSGKLVDLCANKLLRPASVELAEKEEFGDNCYQLFHGPTS